MEITRTRFSRLIRLIAIIAAIAVVLGYAGYRSLPYFRGPTIGQNAKIGTGAKIIGPVTVHRGASIGANAVVVNDVPADTAVAGVKARPTSGNQKR